MAERIVVINPNSSEVVTRGIDVALDPLRLGGGPEIECGTLTEGPPGIQTEQHIAHVTMPLCRIIESDRVASAFVIACCSYPGLRLARECMKRPVFGVAEAGMTAALNQGNAGGVISILRSAVERHHRYFRSLGISRRIARDTPIDLAVSELEDEARTFKRMREVGAHLRDCDGADVLVMGCAGMARYRTNLEDALDVPVVDPTQAAGAIVVAALQLGLRTR